MLKERKSARAWLILPALLAAVLAAVAFQLYGTNRSASDSTSQTGSAIDIPASPSPSRGGARSSPRDPYEGWIRTAQGELLPQLFRDMTLSSGISFTYRSEMDSEHFAILDMMGGGVALLDYDGDGLLDVFVTGGGRYGGPDRHQILGNGNRLYKNLGEWRFRDVTQEVGLDQPSFYSHGCAVADYDRDGWPDLLVTGWGRLALYHNEPNGKGGRRFVEVTKRAGLTDTLWSTSAAWADLDGDGYPDLYVCHYVDWSLSHNPICPGFSSSVPRDICGPQSFSALPHILYRNNGNGTFTDVSREAGIRPHTGDPSKDREAGKGLGVVIADLDDDGKPDIYVANDTSDNFLYRNLSSPGKLRFEEIGMQAGAARDDHGAPNGSMGVDLADEMGTGRPSLFVTNYENEMHSLFRSRHKGLFIYSSPTSGVGVLGRSFVGFGTGFLDLDNDGWEDLMIAHGHVIRFPTIVGARSGDPAPTAAQRPVLLRNLGNGHYRDISKQGGDYFQRDHLGRGVAVGDLDNDGRPDLVISHLNEPVALLRNEADVGHHWLGIDLLGKGRRDVVGSKVILEIGSRRLVRFAKGGGSYLSSSDRRHLFGLGKAERVDRVTVVWSGGRQQSWNGAAFTVDRYWRLSEGQDAIVDLSHRK
jgi:hypothetical protein